MSFCYWFNVMSLTVHDNAREKGFYESSRSTAEMIALMHSELSEALEADRHGNPASEHIPEFSALEEEFADVIIRVMDTAVHLKLRLAEAILAKHAFNVERPAKHGKEY